MSLSFRDAVEADAPLLAGMNERLIRDQGHRNPMTREELTDRMRNWLVTREYEAVLFEAAGTAAGYALYRREPEFISLRQFYVEPVHRRQGVGRAAFEWLCASRWGGSRRVRIDVLVNNEAARQFWRGVGFEDYCITMERDL